MIINQTHSLFEDIVETIREPILVLDSDLKVLVANRSFINSFKVNQEETIGTFIYDLGNQQWDIPKLRELLETILPEKTNFDDYEVEHDFVTIGRRIMLLNARQIKRAFGKEHIILLAFEDITEHKRLEDLLAESEVRYRRLFETANDGILLLEKSEFKIRQANPAISSIFGYSNMDCIGKEMKDVGFTFERGTPQELLQRLDIEGVLHFDDIPVETKDGHTIDTDIYMVDKTSLVQCNIRDITFRKQSQKEVENHARNLKKIFDSTPNILVLVNDEGRVEMINRKGATLTKRNNETLAGLLGGEVLNCLNSFEGEGCGNNIECSHCPVRTRIMSTFETGKPHTEEEGCMTFLLDGKKTSMDLLISTTLLNINGIDKVLLSLTDTTTLKNLEVRIQQAQKMEAIGALAGGIAHDFNNILFPIVCNTEMMMDDVPEDSPQRESLNEIYTASLRARELVKQILSFSRQEISELKQVMMQPIIKEALKLIRSTLPATIGIKQNIDKNCGAIIADPTNIHQIIMNLATNAFHAMGDKIGELMVSLKETKLSKQDLITPDMKPGSYICLTVSDSGKGMDKDVAEKIFEPYYTTKSKNKGTGLGLSVVHSIVKSYGGGINFKSTPGEGTTFDIYIPKSEIEPEYATQAESLSNPVGYERILIVDDETAVLKLEKNMLEKLGYSVESFNDSLLALERFKTLPHSYDMVITDMTMPGMTGDKLIREVLKTRSDIPCIICTGFNQKIFRKTAEELGAKHVLIKPIIATQFANKVREVLDSAKRKQEN